MPYFFSKNKLEKNKTVELEGDEARHVLLSHRVKIGEIIKLQGPDGKRFSAQVLTVSKNSFSAAPVEELVVAKELPAEVTLFLSVISEKALDFVLQKATELGASGICLFNSKNTAVKLTKDLFGKKHLRWEKILNEAAKQSERAKWPNLTFLQNTQELVLQLKNFDAVFLADISGGLVELNTPALKKYAVLVGPEGGFNSEEVKEFTSLKNVNLIKLSPFVLRAETAAISALSVINSKII